MGLANGIDHGVRAGGDESVWGAFGSESGGGCTGLSVSVTFPISVSNISYSDRQTPIVNLLFCLRLSYRDAPLNGAAPSLFLIHS